MLKMRPHSSKMRCWDVGVPQLFLQHFSSFSFALSILQTPVAHSGTSLLPPTPPPPPVFLLSRWALSGITSAVIQNFSNDLNMTSGLQSLHTDKAPQAFVSALSATSACDPKDTQCDELRWPLSHPRVPGPSCTMHATAGRIFILG